jgi:hypothetical protein
VTDIVVWNEQSTYPGAPYSGTLSFDQVVYTANVYDPSSSATTPIQTNMQVSGVNFTTSGAPVVIEVTPYTVTEFSSCTVLAGAITGNGCYVAHLHAAVSSTTATRLTEDGGAPTSSNSIVIPAGYSGEMVMSGGAHDATNTTNKFPGLDNNILRTIQTKDSGTSSIITNSGGGATSSASGYSQTIGLDSATVPHSLNFTVQDANADPTNWDIYVTIYASH